MTYLPAGAGVGYFFMCMPFIAAAGTAPAQRVRSLAL